MAFHRHNQRRQQGDGRYSQSHVHLEGVVDAPLQTCQRSDHDNTQGEPTGEQRHPVLHRSMVSGVCAPTQANEAVIPRFLNQQLAIHATSKCPAVVALPFATSIATSSTTSCHARSKASSQAPVSKMREEHNACQLSPQYSAD